MAHNDRHDPAIPALGRYWDALLHGRPADRDNLDPALAETVQQLHARDDAPGADQAFAATLLTNLEERMNTTYGDLKAPTDPLRLSMMPSPNGRRPISLPWLPLAPRTSSRSRGWPMTHIATAALVLFTLTFAYLALGPARFGRQAEQPAGLPAALSTPASPSAGMIAEETLAEITLPEEAVPATIYSGQNHYTIPPGSSGRWEPSSFSPTCCTGPRLNYVLEGTYTVRGDGPMQVLRSGAAQWEDVPAGTEIMLEPGDALLSWMDDSFDAVNSGSAPVELLDGILFDGGMTTDPIPQKSGGGPAWTFHDQDIMLTQQPVPSEPVILRLRQATLPKGGVLPRPPGAILQLAVSLDAGDVVLTENPHNPNPFELGNLGSGPATIYILSLEPAGAASPTAAGTPGA
jgi:hypothetical protein